MLPLLHLFGLTIQTPLLAVLLGMTLGLMLIARLATERGLKGNELFDAGFYGLIAGVLGARAGYVVANFAAYGREPLSALIPSTTALLPETGWLCGIVFAAIYLWRKHLFSPDLPDLIAPGIAVFAMGMALGSFFSGDSFGIPAQLPWSIYLWGEWRHPVQLYEAAGLAAILVALLYLLRRRVPEGVVALAFVGLYGGLRALIDATRAGVPTLFGLRITQLAGVAAAVAALWLIMELYAGRTSAARVQTDAGSLSEAPPVKTGEP